MWPYLVISTYWEEQHFSFSTVILLIKFPFCIAYHMFICLTYLEQYVEEIRLKTSVTKLLLDLNFKVISITCCVSFFLFLTHVYISWPPVMSSSFPTYWSHNPILGNIILKLFFLWQWKHFLHTIRDNRFSLDFVSNLIIRDDL